MARLLRSFLVLLVLATTVARAARYDPIPGADEKWRCYTSAHFEVYSRNSESESRELLQNLELAHAIFFETFKYKVSRAVPVTVYFFSREKHFEAYKPEAMRPVETVSAFYHGDLDRGVMTIAPLPTYEAAQRLAFGCYTYHLFRLIGDRPPTWFSYGMAGLFGNLELLSTQFELGKADPAQISRLRTANLIPMEAMLAADQKSSVFTANRNNHLFHDESWAIIHYLYFGQHSLKREQIEAFVGYALAHGGDYDAAATREVFERTLGLTYEKLNDELDRYFRSGRYSYRKLPLPAVPAAKGFAVRKVPLEEIRLRLAELALRVNRAPEGKLALLQLTPAAADYPRVQEVLAAEALKDGDANNAAERLWRAVDAGSRNPAVLRELGQYEDRLRFRRFDIYYRLPEEDAAKLRAMVERSIEVAPQQTAAYELLAWVEAFAPAPSIANVNRVQRQFEELTDPVRTLVALAIVRFRLDDKAGAAEMLDQAMRMNPDDWVRSAVEHTRARIEDRPVNRANLPSRQPSSGGSVLGRPVKRPGS